MSAILDLFRDVLPQGAHVPKDWREVKKSIKDVGLGHSKIHACENDCMLFWKEDETLEACKFCKQSRYKPTSEWKKSRSVPKKVLRYFPITPRLKRLFTSYKMAENMHWHNEERTRQLNGKMHHPADSEAWLHFDQTHPDFSSEIRNVRLGLTSDGFNPFGSMSSTTTIWPIICFVYNLPPWLCMKAEHFMLSLLIPGPHAPGNDIDVYLQPLVEEFRELWEEGANTYDAFKKENFMMQAALLWTINVFPAYANLSGWSTKGKLACPVCNVNTFSDWLNKGRKHCYLGHRRFLPLSNRWRTPKYMSKFDGHSERGHPPHILSGVEIWSQQQSISHVPFGKTFKTDLARLSGWKKKSIFFRLLPYWTDLLLRHNLDVMHIEKNVMDNILSILNLSASSKDGVPARLDLEEWDIHEELYVERIGDSKYRVPDAIYTLSSEKRAAILNFLQGVKVPDGYSSNLSRCINITEKKISGLKSHDSHIYMQVLFPHAIRGIVDNVVADPIIEMSRFFKILCSKVLDPVTLLKWESDLAVTLCKMEQIFPPSFFDIMVHLTIHLAYQARVAGPVQYRWMYPIEHYLKKLKDYVMNKAQPDGSIVEGYLVEECSSFCSLYLDGSSSTSDDVNQSVLFHTGRPIQGAECRYINEGVRDLAHLYVLMQSDDVDPLINEYKSGLTTGTQLDTKFIAWFQQRVNEFKNMRDTRLTVEMDVLSSHPSRLVHCYTGYIVNGFRFRIKAVDDTKATQLSGVIVKAELDSGCDGYYGQIKSIMEMSFDSTNRVVLFEVDWFDVYRKDRGFKIDKHGFISLNKRRRLQTNEPFALASQVEQVFYVQDNMHADWVIPIRTLPRDYYDVVEDSPVQNDDEPYQECLEEIMLTSTATNVDIVSIRGEEFVDLVV